METAADKMGQLTATSKNFARTLLTIGENRLELLTVEVQEEGRRFFQASLTALGLAVFVLLAGITFTAAIVIWFRTWSPVAILLVFTGLYVIAAVLLYRRFARLPRDWQPFSASLDQLRKDRAFLESILT